MPQHQPPEGYISIETAAEILEISPRTVRRMISESRLTGYRLGPRLLRVKRSEVDGLLRVIPTGQAS